jgi:N-acetyl sugar amidotransferase
MQSYVGSQPAVSGHGHQRDYYRVCVRCVMDTSDPEITFDDASVCNHCRKAEVVLAGVGDRQGVGAHALARLANEARRHGQGRPYDVVIGLSGGVDSTYVAYLAVRKLGLRPLAIHFDNGWNSELAVHNIERTVERLGIDLYTHVVDWQEFRDLQLAFFKSHTSNLEIPTDHAIQAILYQQASKHGIRHVLSGSNAATELILPDSWQHGAADLTFLLAIHKQFGTQSLRTFPMLGLRRLTYYTVVRNVRFHRVLNLIDYNKAETIETISRELDWRPYGVKHGESTFTRFFQCYIQPRKFGFDKRRAHLSSLIASGQMTRQAAMFELQKNDYMGTDLEANIGYVIKKLGMSRQQFDEYMDAPPVPAATYPNQLRLQARLRPIWEWIRDRR